MYLELSGDAFFQNFSMFQCHQLLSAFAQATRDFTFVQSPLGNDNLVAGTCFATVNNVAHAFEASGFPKPTLDALGKSPFCCTACIEASRTLMAALTTKIASQLMRFSTVFTDHCSVTTGRITKDPQHLSGSQRTSSTV